METDTLDFPCVKCKKNVEDDHEAVQCDNCCRWQHRTCRTGISKKLYWKSVKDGKPIQFTCSDCVITNRTHSVLESTRLSTGESGPSGPALIQAGSRRPLRAARKRHRLVDPFRIADFQTAFPNESPIRPPTSDYHISRQAPTTPASGPTTPAERPITPTTPTSAPSTPTNPTSAPSTPSSAHSAQSAPSTPSLAPSTPSSTPPTSPPPSYKSLYPLGPGSPPPSSLASPPPSPTLSAPVSPNSPPPSPAWEPASPSPPSSPVSTIPGTPLHRPPPSPSMVRRRLAVQRQQVRTNLRANRRMIQANRRMIRCGPRPRHHQPHHRRQRRPPQRPPPPNPPQQQPASPTPRPPVHLHDSLEESTLIEDVPNQLSSLMEDEPEITYTVINGGAQRGGRPALFDSLGYKYTPRGDLSASKVTWRCTCRRKGNVCRASVHQEGDIFTRQGPTHSHDPTPGAAVSAKISQEAKKIGREKLFDSATEITEAIVRDHLQDQPVDDELIRRIAKQVNYDRAKGRPKHPSSLDDSVNVGAIPPNFFRKEVIVGGKKHLILATQQQLVYLANAKRWYADATFKVVKAPYTQLFSIHAFLKVDNEIKQVPLVYVLMSSRRARDYKAVLKAIIAILPSQPRVRQVVLDFERAMWKGFYSALGENLDIRGCNFHWGQALIRKVQSLGLMREYCKHNPTHRLIRQLLALPYLPSDKIPKAFSKLKRRCVTPKLTELAEYIQKQWVKSRFFRPSTWCVYGRLIRTNNDAEGWHNRLNQRAKGPLNMYLLFLKLHEESANVKIQAQQLSSGCVLRARRAKPKEQQAKLQKAWEAYQEYSISLMGLVRKVSKVVKVSN